MNKCVVSSDLWVDFNSRLQEILMIIENVFAGLSVMTVSDFLQLHPVLGKFIFSLLSDKDSMKHSLGFKLWRLTKYTELTEVVRQSDRPFIDMLNKVRVGNANDFYETLMKTTIQKILCTFMQKMNQLSAEMKLFLIIYLVRSTL